MSAVPCSATMQQNGVLAGERLVFMYGTLKAGQPNHHYIRDAANGRAEFICSARSVQCFPLVVATIHRLPFLLWLPGEGRVSPPPQTPP